MQGRGAVTAWLREGRPASQFLPQEDDEIVALCELGWRPARIGHQICRPRTSVINRLKWLMQTNRYRGLIGRVDGRALALLPARTAPLQQPAPPPREKAPLRQYKNSWSPDESARAVALAEHGWGRDRIGRWLGRPGMTVDWHLKTLRQSGQYAALIGRFNGATLAQQVPPVVKKARPRPCLSCSETFDSEGPGNRLCANCRARANKYDLNDNWVAI